MHNDIVSDVNLSAKRDINIKVSDYAPHDMTDTKLKSDFRQLCALSTRRQTRFSNEDIILLGRKITRELISRDIKFSKRNMQPATLRLIDKITADKEFNMKSDHKQDPPKSDGENYSTALEYDLSDIKDMDGFRQIEHVESAEGTEEHTYDLYYAGGEYWLADDGIIKWRSMKDLPHEAIEEWHRVTGLRLQIEDLRALKKNVPQDYKGFEISWDGTDVYAIEKKTKSFADGDKFMPGDDKFKYISAIVIEDGIEDRLGQVKISLEGQTLWTDKDNVNKKAGKNFTKSTIELDFIKPTKPYLDMAAHISNEFFVLEDMKDFDYTNRILEKKYDGLRMQTHKRGNSVKFYTAYGNQIPLNRLGNIPNEIRALISHAVILDGELILPGLDRDFVHDAVTTNGSDELEYRVFDILQVNDSRFIDSPLKERRQILERLPPSSHVKVSPALPVTSDQRHAETT